LLNGTAEERLFIPYLEAAGRRTRGFHHSIYSWWLL
jgi:hypothetical protein